MENSKMKNIMIVIAIGLILGGCASTKSSIETRTLVLTKCPVLKKYSVETLRKAALSLKNLPSDDELEELLDDYGKLREACRAAERTIKISK